MSKELAVSYYNHLIEIGTRTDVALRKTAKTYGLTTKNVKSLVGTKPNKAEVQRNTLIKYLHKEVGLGIDEISVIIDTSPQWVRRFLK